MKCEFKGCSIWNGIQITSTFDIHEAARQKKKKKNPSPPAAVILQPLDSLNFVTNFHSDAFLLSMIAPNSPTVFPRILCTYPEVR